ncbi:MAG: hypothetical protein ABW127_11335 [Candidatus Thiodiazotropha endolucinida]
MNIHRIKNQALMSAKGYLQRFIREGFSFQNALSQLKELEDGSESYRKSYQLNALKKITQHAGQHIPHWRETFTRCGFDPNGITSIDDLKCLPLLTKQEVNANRKSFLSEIANHWALTKGTTSGTTGTPGVFYRDMHSVVLENAMIWHVRQQAGMIPGERMSWIRGDMFLSPDQHKPPFWMKNYGTNMLFVSSYHLIPEYREQILNAMEHYGADCAYAYPSAAYTIARWCQELGRRLPFNNLNTSSETVLDEHRETIASVLNGHWIDHYGQAERVCFFANFDGGEFLEYSEYGVTELLPLDDGRFEVVASNLHNMAMPLFRYRTGDVVEKRVESGDSRPKIIGLMGRKDDFVKLPDNRLIGRLGSVFKGLEAIEEAQIYQAANGAITLRIVPGQSYGPGMEERLMKNARERIGHDITIEVQRMDAIPRTKNGKLKFIVSDCV